VGKHDNGNIAETHYDKTFLTQKSDYGTARGKRTPWELNKQRPAVKASQKMN
jgi:hypothetical protein